MTDPNPYPSIGRTVHYTSYGTPGGEFGCECRAAIVTSLDNPNEISIAVLNPTGMFFNRGVKFGDPGQGGTWHWPEHTESTIEVQTAGDIDRTALGKVVSDALHEYQRRGGSLT